MPVLRDLPEVPLSDCPPEYARLCASNWDTVQEALDLRPTEDFTEVLRDAKKRAIEVQEDLAGFVFLDLGDERFRCCAVGAKGGFQWRLETDDFLIFISARKEWSISVRYLSAGLWQYALHELRERVFRALGAYTIQTTLDCVRVSRADFCFDFWSPAFSKEFTPALARSVVAHSSVKTKEKGLYDSWNCGARGETLTIGSMAGLQVQLYDKTREIDEKSGKTWLYAIWRAVLGFNPWKAGERPRDVWRLECRYSGDFLRERNLRRPFEVIEALPELLAEALYKRRLGVPDKGPCCPTCKQAMPGDSNRWRWPMHPLFSEAYRSRGAGFMLPVGKQITGRRSALLDKAIAQIAGAARSAAVLSDGTFDPDTMRALFDQAAERAEADPLHERKVERAQDRYATVEAAK